ncbi:MAG: ABC transporter substrate-binding protein [Spirochaetales bacterium]|nr:ABC transporter substrate-binding protein [Spirochaetales bacterium]
MRKRLFLAFILFFIITILVPAQVLEPFSKRVKQSVENYKSSSWLKVPLITWGADIVTIHANGGKTKTTSNSPFDKKGLKVELFREDNFQKQVEMYLKGDIAFLRGTMGMINMAADITNRDNRTKLVVVYQHSWSAGGDVLVVKEGIRSVKDLKGKTISIQSYGPHIDYMMKLLSDANLSINDVKIIWTRDLVGPEGDTPMAKFYNNNVQATFVIITDALALTSNGNVGTGAEDSVKGARILLSTKTANRIISDVYAVRKDYFDANKDKVKSFVHALLIAEEEVKDIFKNTKSTSYRNLITDGASILLDSAQAGSEVAGMYYDAENVGFNGNVKYFKDTSYPRNFDKHTNEIQKSFINLKLLSKTTKLDHGNWNYTDFKSGLKYADLKEASRFDSEEVTEVIAKKQMLDTLDESALFAFMIFFKPNQNTFSVDLYKDEFNKVIDLSATYGGAIITVEGHSDPMEYLRKKKEGAQEVVLSRIKQAAKNLSYSRANAVRDEIITYASNQGITLDPNQFATIGYGITKPVHDVPKTEEQWLANMRVEFKIIQVEAESGVFVPLD